MKVNISTKLSVLIICLIVVFGLLLGWFLVDRETQILSNEMELRARTITRNLAFNSEYGMLVGDVEELKRLVSGVMRESDVVYVELLDQLGTKVVRTDNLAADNILSINEPITTRQAISSEDLLTMELQDRDSENEEVIGNVRLDISRQGVIDKITLLKKVVFLVIMLMVGIYTFVAYWGIGYLVSKPLDVLVTGIEKIRQGDLSHRIDLSSHDEMNDLADSFNLMARELSQTLVTKDFVNSIILSMMDSLLVLNTEGYITIANQAALDMLGYEAR
ncbi:MAG: HAMP domain-containing protein, partial [Thermodesulfobacteriota bacterium]